MSGPEHYREAERLVAIDPNVGTDEGQDTYANALAAAQVHATLALAAIQAERWIDGDAHDEWPQVIA